MRRNMSFVVKVGMMLLFILHSSLASAQMKREMRGAWIQCVNGQFQGLGTEKMQQMLTYQLDELQKDGVNLIIFQVRPECDALYESIALLGSPAVDDYRVPQAWYGVACLDQSLSCEDEDHQDAGF